MIVIIDYGLCNLHSVDAAVKKLGYNALISNKVEDIEMSEKLILPGVGAFGDAMKNLKKLGLIEALTSNVIKKKKPILGICLGFQLMAKESFEFGHHQGLGWLDASVKKLHAEKKNIRVPHVGWDELIQEKKSPLFENVPKDALFYYTHSFYLDSNNENMVIGRCNYGSNFIAAIQQDNIYGTQFHPEKSQLYGLTVLKNYLEKC